MGIICMDRRGKSNGLRGTKCKKGQHAKVRQERVTTTNADHMMWIGILLSLSCRKERVEC